MNVPIPTSIAEKLPTSILHSCSSYLQEQQYSTETILSDRLLSDRLRMLEQDNRILEELKDGWKELFYKEKEKVEYMELQIKAPSMLRHAISYITHMYDIKTDSAVYIKTFNILEDAYNACLKELH